MKLKDESSANNKNVAIETEEFDVTMEENDSQVRSNLEIDTDAGTIAPGRVSAESPTERCDSPELIPPTQEEETDFYKMGYYFSMRPQLEFLPKYLLAANIKFNEERLDTSESFSTIFLDAHDAVVGFFKNGSDAVLQNANTDLQIYTTYFENTFNYFAKLSSLRAHQERYPQAISALNDAEKILSILEDKPWSMQFRNKKHELNLAKKEYEAIQEKIEMQANQQVFNKQMNELSPSDLQLLDAATKLSNGLNESSLKSYLKSFDKDFHFTLSTCPKILADAYLKAHVSIINQTDKMKDHLSLEITKKLHTYLNESSAVLKRWQGNNVMNQYYDLNHFHTLTDNLKTQFAEKIKQMGSSNNRNSFFGNSSSNEQKIEMTENTFKLS